MKIKEFRVSSCARCGDWFAKSGRSLRIYCGKECEFPPARTGEQMIPVFLDKMMVSDGCWEWSGAKRERGYGYLTFKYAPKPLISSRMSFMIFNGYLGEKFACHRCDNPNCVNPSHLFAGTAADNNKDTRDKGRNVRGEKCWMSKLNEKFVMALRVIYANERTPIRHMARELGCSETILSNALRGKTWAHLPGAVPA